MWKIGVLGCTTALLATAVAHAQFEPAEDWQFAMPQPVQAVLIAAPETPPQIQYWLGVQCGDVPAAVRQQLALPAKQGFLVEAVIPDSPAAKAGLSKYDILWMMEDKALAEPRDLIQTVENAKGAKITIEVIRSGKHQKVVVTPEKRPTTARQQFPESPDDADWKLIQKWMQGQMANQGGQHGAGPLHFRFLHPGAIVPAAPLPPMPDDMSVVITKQGEQPCQITVKQGDAKWTATDKELAKLPDAVRPYVERMLGRGAFGLVGVEQSLDYAPEVAPATQSDAAAQAPSPNRMEQRIDEMNQRIDRLMKSFEASLEKPEAPANDKPAPAAPKAPAAANENVGP